MERLSQPSRPRQSVRPIGLRGPSKLPTGPRLYSGQPERRGAGAGPPPEGFVGGSTSGSEWIAYAAAAKVMNDPPDPRQPSPGGGYWGGVSWGYQIPILGTYTRELGSAVADYIFYGPRIDIIVRLQTRRFNEGFGASKTGLDQLQRAQLGRMGIVVDIWEGGFMDADPDNRDKLNSGPVLQAACAIMRDAISSVERGSPIFLGTSQARG
jgi:hypothetical protein